MALACMISILTPGCACSRFFIYLIVNVLMHIASVTLFRATAAIGRQVVLANILSFVAIAMTLLFTGFIIPQREPAYALHRQISCMSTH